MATHSPAIGCTLVHSVHVWLDRQAQRRAVSHRALAAALLSWERLLPHTRASRLLQLASPGFDVSLFEVCLPLGLGFSVATAPKDVLLTDLEAAFPALRITMADLPAALAALVHPDHVPPLEWLMSGGDVIDERVVRAWGAPCLLYTSPSPRD